MGGASLKLVFFLLLALTSGGVWYTEAARAARSHHRRHVNCSSDDYCNPFGKKIDWRCQYADACQERCNSFDGVFTCSDEGRYCLCQM